ncbi:MAG: GNAT family N-acetyltransferase [Christensenellales bacterium]|jgi:ribosomal-protein-alanine N-acetyltransferase
MMIETASLVIRELKMDDALPLFEAMECPQVHEMYDNGFTAIDNVRSYIGLIENEYQQGKHRTLAISERASGRLIGNITLDVIAVFLRAELNGYWIDKRWRGRGYATQAVKAMAAHCFDNLGMNRVQAMTSNPASARVLEKAGMSHEGILRQYIGMNGVFRDLSMFAILRRDYEPSGKSHGGGATGVSPIDSV